jgi:N-sulfoglucosamine sulfohydrolase
MAPYHSVPTERNPPIAVPRMNPPRPRPTALAWMLPWLLGLPLLLPAAERPNILFAIADDWGTHAGAYGTPWVRTPAFDRVAREGLLFTHAYTPNAKCAPSRACLLTGRNPWQLKAAANHIPYFPPEFKGWAEALADHGWFVGFTQKGWGPGVATNAQGQPRLMTGRRFDARKTPPPTSGISPIDYAANFEDFLQAAPTNAPWCFWYGAIEPHRGYEFGSGTTRSGRSPADIDRVPGYWPDHPTVRQDLLDYAFEVEHFDRHLERMLASLDRRGLSSNTLVVVTSDHGPPFPRVKGQAYPFANHVPFAARWPAGIHLPGRVLHDFVSFVDLAPTFLELAGLTWAQSGLAPSPGRSLVPLFRSPRAGRVDPARDHVLIGRERQDVGRPADAGYPVRGIVTADAVYLENHAPDRWPTGNPETGYLDCDASPTKTLLLDAHRRDPADRFWQYCFGRRGAEEFYDLRRDPDCLTNLAGTAAAEPARTELATRLHETLRAQEDPRMSGQGDVFDRYEHANPGHVRFHERYLRGEPLKAGWVNPTDFEPPPPPPAPPPQPRHDD